MTDLSVSYIFGQAWALTKKNFLWLVGTFVVFYLIVGGVSVFSMLPPGASISDIAQPGFHPAQGNGWMGNAVTYLISFIFTMGYYTSALRVSRGTGTMTLDCFLRPLMLYVKYFAVIILVSLATIAGLCLLIVPGIYVAIRLAFSVIYLLDHPEAGVMESIKASWHMTADHVLELIGLYIVAIFVGLLGFLCCCVGFFVAYPVVIMALVQIYLVLNDEYMQQTASR